MATGAGSSNQGTSATRGSAPDSDESNEYQSEWDMDEARGLRPDPTGGGRRAFDPNRAPPPESLDPDYGRRDIGGDGEARLRRRAAGLSERQAARAENGAGKNSSAATHRCDWDTVFIVVLACVLFSFLVLDVYAQIVSKCLAVWSASRLAARSSLLCFYSCRKCTATS